jgi:phosphatidylserine decarboxylase
MFAADGYKIIFSLCGLTVVLIVLTYLFPGPVLKSVTALVFLACLFNLYFLRDPERQIPEGDHLILSPADGTVLKIEQIDEPYYFHGRVTCVSIFMSVLNVHVNRIPISGTVELVKYIKGEFRVASVDKASELNEQSIIGIRQGDKKVLFKQIAGIIARRIVFHLQEGQQVIAGERFGLIRYGSRVNIFFAGNVQVKIKPGDKVYGGITVIGEFSKP